MSTARLALLLFCFGIPVAETFAAVNAGDNAPVEGSGKALLKQLAIELYPAAMATEVFSTPFVISLVLDRELKVLSHSGRAFTRRSSAGILAEVFPEPLAQECSSIGINRVRPRRRVDGLRDKGVFAAWCILK